LDTTIYEEPFSTNEKEAPDEENLEEEIKRISEETKEKSPMPNISSLKIEIKKKKRKIRRLKRQVEEIEVLERYIKTQNYLLRG
jgi:hypothetical protein